MEAPCADLPKRGQSRGGIVAMSGVLAALTLLTASCGEDQDDAFDELALRGRVVDDLTDKGLGGATVVFVSDTLDESRSTTDGDGRFQMRVELAAQVRLGHLYAEASGYQPSRHVSIYFDGTERSAELRLRPRP